MNAQCRSIPIKILELIQDTSQWRSPFLIGIGNNSTILIGIDRHLSGIDWALGIDWGSPDISKNNYLAGNKSITSVDPTSFLITFYLEQEILINFYYVYYYLMDHYGAVMHCLSQHQFYKESGPVLFYKESSLVLLALILQRIWSSFISINSTKNVVQFLLALILQRIWSSFISINSTKNLVQFY